MSAEDKTTGNKNKITITNDKGRLRCVGEEEGGRRRKKGAGGRWGVAEPASANRRPGCSRVRTPPRCI